MSTTPLVSDDEPLPIDAMLSGSGATTASRQHQFDRYQALLAECMAQEGFDYFPVEINAEVAIEDLPSAELQSFASQHGYGLTELVGPPATALDAIRAGVLPYHIEFDLSALGIQIHPEMDQNDLYVQALGGDEVNAYYTALDGPPPVDRTLDTDDLGCSSEAEAAIDAELADQEAAAPEWLGDAMFLMVDRMQSAKGQFDQVEGLWTECMSEEGFDGFTERLDAPESIRASILTVVLETENVEAELDAGEIQRLHQHEMALAVADAHCYSTVYRPAVRGIEYRVQTEVLTELGVLEG